MSDMPSDIFDADLGQVVSRNSVTAVLTRKNGSVITGIAGILTPVSQRQKDIDAGFITDFDATFTVQVSLLPATKPVRGDTLTIASLDYQIIEFETEPSGVAISYKLNSTTK